MMHVKSLILLIQGADAAALFNLWMPRDSIPGVQLQAESLTSFTTASPSSSLQLPSSETISTRTLIPPTTRAFPTTTTSTIISASTPATSTTTTAAIDDPHEICNSAITTPEYVNYTQPYTCSLSHDYAILGLYYDECSLVNLTISAAPMSPTTSSAQLLSAPSDTTSLSAPAQPTATPNGTDAATADTNLTFCCDPSYSQPTSFDTMCVWGKGINMSDPNFDPRDVARPPGVVGTCFVSPIIEPAARCVQLP